MNVTNEEFIFFVYFLQTTDIFCLPKLPTCPCVKVRRQTLLQQQLPLPVQTSREPSSQKSGFGRKAKLGVCVCVCVCSQALPSFPSRLVTCAFILLVQCGRAPRCRGCGNDVTDCFAVTRTLILASDDCLLSAIHSTSSRMLYFSLAMFLNTAAALILRLWFHCWYSVCKLSHSTTLSNYNLEHQNKGMKFVYHAEQ